MKKTIQAASFLALSTLLLGVTGLTSLEKEPVKKTILIDTLPTVIATKVLDTIHNCREIPGLTAGEWSTLKNELFALWKRLSREGVIEVHGTDKEVRPSFVALQAVLEHVLAGELQSHIKALKGIIHTPMPATPLCSTGEISKKLVDLSIESDPARLFTVKARTTIVREYLSKGGYLYMVYPKSGYAKRTDEQQRIYQQELNLHPKNLFDIPLDSESMPHDLIGATYLFEDSAGSQFVFAIKMTQAKDAGELGHFGLWFGSPTHPAVQKRLQAVFAFLEQHHVHIVNP